MDMKIISQGCTLDCFDACKLNIYVDGDEVIKIEGDKNHPYTKGFICNKGRAHLERLSHKDRIYTPLLKVNDRWIEISFEEAIKIMATKLMEYKEKYSSQSVMYYEQYGNGSLLKSIGDIFFNFYGGVSKQKGGPCWSAGIKAQEYDFGDVRGHALEDMKNSKSIFIWGKNPAYTTIHTMQMLKQAKNGGAKIIVIDPIKTTTANISDYHIQVNPGTDGALAMAMTKIIIESNLQDEEYISKNVLGYEEYKAYLDTLDLAYLSTECGIKIEIIKELALIYSEKYSSIWLGYGMQKYKNGGNTIRAIDALGAITGQIGYTGGGINYANKVYPDVLNLDPYESHTYAHNREFYVNKLSEFIDNLNNNNKEVVDNDYIKMAVIVKSNLLNQLPDLNKLEKSFESIEFKVCFDMFMTDTASKCDLFIPCTTTLESEDLLFSSMSNPYLTYNEKAIKPKNMLMDEYYFFRELAKVMNIKSYPQVSKEEYLTKVIEPLKNVDKDISLNKIKDDYITIHNSVPWSDYKFKTKSGKFEIYSSQLKALGISPIPIYTKPEKKDKDQLRLITNHHRETLFSQHYMDKKGISQAYINEKMAMIRNIAEKEIVYLRSKNGEIEVEINIDNNIKDGIVKMYVGWWKKHGNPNFVTSSDISDIGGQVTYNETFVDIIKQN
ncbi:MAG: molybdopterin-dependent oxidoreductase [Peptostreptococcaceae bacterium]